MDWIFFDLPEAEIGGVDWPIVGAYFLLSRIVILMRFKVELSNFLCFRHVLCRVNGILHSPLIGLSCKAKPELFFICLFWEAVLSIDCASKRFSL